MRIALIVLVLLSIKCKSDITKEKIKKQELEINSNESKKELDNKLMQNVPIANAFDYPVGKPDAKGYYNAQKFGENYHLGDDWNATTGGNSDLGDPIYAIGNGFVIKANEEGGGWGNVIIIRHKLPNGKEIESLYAHCERMDVKEKEIVEKGHQIGTIGNADGIYLAHLHFEIRNQVGMTVGSGYSTETNGYLDPTKFILENRVIRNLKNENHPK